MWVIPSEDGILVEKHLGKAPFYFPLLEICNQTRILKAKESCLTFFSAEFWNQFAAPPNLFSQRTHSYIERDFKSSALILSARLSLLWDLCGLTCSWQLQASLVSRGPEIGWFPRAVNLLGQCYLLPQSSDWRYPCLDGCSGTTGRLLCCWCRGSTHCSHELEAWWPALK